MPVAAIALDIDEPLDVHRDVLAQVAFDIALVLNDLADAVYLVLVQVLDLLERIDVRLVQNLERTRVADPEDIRERDPACLLRGRSTPAIRAI